jgi:hypothetical protein
MHSHLGAKGFEGLSRILAYKSLIPIRILNFYSFSAGGVV